LALLDKKIESEREDSSDISGILTQEKAQLESIQRLVTTAEERLNQEKEALIEVEQQVEFAENDYEKQNAESRLKSIKSHIEELEFEIKSRQKTAKKIAEQVAKNSDTKSKITSKIKKQFQSKPHLREIMTTSHRETEKFSKQLEKNTKREENAKKFLGKAVVKLRELQLKKKKSKRTPKKTAPKRKAARKLSKRTAPKKTAPKRKAARKLSKRTAPKKTAPKRKAARRPSKRTVNLKSGGTIDVCDAVMADGETENDEIKLTLWGDDIKAVNVGDTVVITNGYTNSFKDEVSLTKGKFGKMEINP